MSDETRDVARQTGRALGGVLQPPGMRMEGLEDPLPIEQQRPPLLKIVHPGSLKKGDARKAGQLQLGKLCLDDPEVVFLKRTFFRELEEGKDKDRKTVCASDDGRVPMVAIAEAKHDVCKENECPYATWDTDAATEKRVPPKCKLGYAFVGVLPSHGYAPFIFTTKNWEGVDAAKQLVQDMVTDLNEPRPRGLYDFTVKITTEERRNGGVVYFVPIFTAVRRPLEKDDPYREMFLAVKDVVYQPYITGDGMDAEESEEKDVTPKGDDAAKAAGLEF